MGIKSVIAKAVKGGFARLGVTIHGRDYGEDNFRWMLSHDIRTVLDVGANVGQSVARFRGIFGKDVKIYSFEPLKACYDQLSATAGNDPNWRGYHCALGETDGQAEIRVSAHSPSSSLLPMGELHVKMYPYTAAFTTEAVRVRRLDDVASECDFQDNLLIKMDVQGFEDRVIAGGPRTFARAGIVIAEVAFQELYKGQARFDVLYDMLRPLGLQFAGFLHPVIRSQIDGSMVFGNALFVRNQPLGKAVAR